MSQFRDNMRSKIQEQKLTTTAVAGGGRRAVVVDGQPVAVGSTPTREKGASVDGFSSVLVGRCIPDLFCIYFIHEWNKLCIFIENSGGLSTAGCTPKRPLRSVETLDEKMSVDDETAPVISCKQRGLIDTLLRP